MVDVAAHLQQIMTAAARAPSLPESYYIGQEYVEDRTFVDCVIEASFPFAAILERTEFYRHKQQVVIDQNGPYLRVRIFRSISKRLWKDIKTKLHAQKFVIGYVDALLPEVNRLLLDNRYLSGHVLSRTFSIVDILSVSIKHGPFTRELDWPLSIKHFPPAAVPVEKAQEVYVRDFIDAMHSYFRNDFDDCIRRVITSAENLLRRQEPKAAQRDTKRTTVRMVMAWILNCHANARSTGEPHNFRSILRHSLTDDTAQWQRAVRENMEFIYKVRNKIVHNNFRIKPSDGWLCVKAIGTLNYLLQRKSGDREIAQYVFKLSQQFLLLRNFLGEYYNLDCIGRIERRQSDDILIQSPEDLERFMFDGLEITDKERSMVFKRTR